MTPTIYLEIYDYATNINKYFVVDDSVDMRRMSFIYKSNRIWEESDNGVCFKKNRDRDPDLPLTDSELKEFLFVKIRSQTL